MAIVHFCLTLLATVALSCGEEYLVGYDGEVFESLFSDKRQGHLSTFPRCIKVANLSSSIKKRNHSLFDVTAIDLADDEYDKMLIDSDKAALQVFFDLAVLEIIEVDEKQQAVQMSIQTTTKWRDCRLAWNNEHLRTNYIYVEPESFRSLKIFNPHLRLLEENDPRSWLQSEIMVKIDHYGNVTIVREYVTIVSCNIEVVMYPFDTQSCNLTFESPFSKLEVEVVQRIREDVEAQSRALLADGRFIPSDTWEVVIIPLGNSTRDKCKGDWKALKKSRRECLVERALYRLLCHRHPTYQLVHLMFPALLVSLIASCVFIIPHGSGDKMGLCVTLLLSIFIFTQIMYENMPETGSKLPLISQYYIVCVVLISISCMFAAIGTVLSSWSWPVPHNLVWVMKILACCLLLKRNQRSGTNTVRRQGHGGEAEAALEESTDAKVCTLTENNARLTWADTASILDKLFFVVYNIFSLCMFFYFMLHGYLPWRHRFGDKVTNDLENQYQIIQVKLQEPEGADIFR